MAAEKGRSLAETPTWSVATVTTLMVAACFLVERSLSRFAKVSPPTSLYTLAIRLVAWLTSVPARSAVAAQDQAEGHARRAREGPRRYAISSSPSPAAQSTPSLPARSIGSVSHLLRFSCLLRLCPANLLRTWIAEYGWKWTSSDNHQMEQCCSWRFALEF